MLKEALTDFTESFDFDAEKMEKSAGLIDFIGKELPPLPIELQEPVIVDLSDGEYDNIAACALLEQGTAKVNGGVKLSLDNVSAESVYVINKTSLNAVKVAGIVSFEARGGTFGTIFTGGINGGDGQMEGVSVKLNGSVITSAFYGNGMASNSGLTSIEFTGVTVSGYIYGGSGSYNNAFTTGAIVFNIKSGTYTGQVYGGSRISGNGARALESISESVTLTLSGGNFSNYIFAGGCGAGGSSSGDKMNTATIAKGTSITLNGAQVNHEIYAGGFGAASRSGATNGSAIVRGGTVISAKSGSAVNIYGGGYASGGSSLVEGGALLKITGLGFRQGTTALTIGTIFGGGNGSGMAADGSSLVEGGTRIIVGGNTITDNVITIKDIYGGGNGIKSQVNGGSQIIFAGNFTGKNADKLIISGIVSGAGKNGGDVEGMKSLEFDDYQGTLGAGFVNFDRIVADGYTQAKFGKNVDFSTVNEVGFDFSQGEPISSGDTVFDFLSGVNFGTNTVFNLEFQARSAIESSYTLISSVGNLNISGSSYTIVDSLYGDKFTAAIGDGSSWDYYGYNISMQLTDNKLTLYCIAQA